MLMIFDFLQESFWSLLLVLYLFSISIDELSMLGRVFIGGSETEGCFVFMGNFKALGLEGFHSLFL